MEENGLYAEEQNEFRKGRSCSEHLFVLTTIIRNINLQRKSTFTAFLDAEKAFDKVDRELLLFKLLNIGITGHIYENIKAIYKEVIVDKYLTWKHNVDKTAKTISKNKEIFAPPNPSNIL